MASMGMAWVQGQKNAQDLAKSQIDTIHQMAKSAKEADAVNDYWDPINEMLRKYEKTDLERRIEGRQMLDQYGDILASNPLEGSKKLFAEMYGSKVEENPDGSYTVLSPSGLKVSYGTLPELASAAASSIANTAAETRADLKAKADATIAARTKADEGAREKAMEYSAYKAYIHDPKLRNALELEYMRQRGETGRTAMGNNAMLQGKYIEKELNAKDYPDALNTHLAVQGIFYNKDTNSYNVRVLEDGEPVLKPVENLDPTTWAQVQNTMKETQDYVTKAPKRGLNPYGPLPNKPVIPTPSQAPVKPKGLHVSPDGTTFKDPRTGLIRPISEKDSVGWDWMGGRSIDRRDVSDIIGDMY